MVVLTLGMLTQPSRLLALFEKFDLFETGRF